MKEPLIYIIIVHLNNFQDTFECIRSLKKINYKNYKIVIVDNGSTNDSIERLKDSIYIDKIIYSKKNLGFSGGNNLGIKYVLDQKADYVLLLNNDTYVNNDFLSELVNTFTDYPSSGIVSPKIYYASNPKVIWATGAFENKKSRFGYIDYAFKKNDKEQFNKIASVDCVWGCCMLIKTEIFQKVGLFDSSYFLYYEDADFCYRTKKSGYSIFYNYKAVIYHKVSQSSGGENSRMKDFYNTRNALVFAKKNLRNVERYNYYIFVFIDSIRTILINLTKLKFNNSFEIIKGLIAGYFYNIH